MHFLKNITLALGLLALTACTHDTTPSPASTKDAVQPATLVRVTGIPDENPTELQRKNAPLVAYLAKELGAQVEYVPVTDYGAAVQALSAGQVDFAWLGGFTHVQARTMSSAVPLVMRDIDREFKSIFVAHADSKVSKAEDLKGKTIAFGSKSSTSGHLMPRHFLIDQFQIDPAKDFANDPVFSGAHDATARIVESGKVPAGALNKQVWDRMVSEKKVNTEVVKPIWTSPGYADYVWTARKDVPEDIKQKFINAFLKLDPMEQEHKTVLALQGAQKFVKATPSDFDAIEAVAKSTGLLK